MICVVNLVLTTSVCTYICLYIYLFVHYDIMLLHNCYLFLLLLLTNICDFYFINFFFISSQTNTIFVWGLFLQGNERSDCCEGGGAAQCVAF